MNLVAVSWFFELAETAHCHEPPPTLAPLPKSTTGRDSDGAARRASASDQEAGGASSLDRKSVV